METRDKKVVDFINTVELCNRDHIKELFFKEVHPNICMRRLKKLSEDEYINRIKHDGNTFIYYSDKKPSKRLINHDMHITYFIVEMLKNNYEILDFKKSFVLGPIITDAYIKYKDQEGKVRHCVLEIQLSNRVEDCINKYKNFRNIILEYQKEWTTIPRIICITDMPQRIELRGLKVLYNSTNLENINEILRG